MKRGIGVHGKEIVSIVASVRRILSARYREPSGNRHIASSGERACVVTVAPCQPHELDHSSVRMISYAQNREDVVLHRALCGDGPQVYVDVGAYSPSSCSVTRHFYEAGWRGIDIEPLAEQAAELRQFRPRDWVVEAALGRTVGETTIYVVEDEPSLSSTNVGIGGGYIRDGRPVVERTVVRRTLTDVLEEFSIGAFSFLKIDVEGAEPDVLAGNDWTRWRPRVVVVEATRPWSAEQTHEQWEPDLLASGYLFAAFDGLNRFYARQENPELVPLLSPANVLDNYVAEDVANLQLAVKTCESSLTELKLYVAHVEQDLRLKDLSLQSLVDDARQLQVRLEERDESVERLQSEIAAIKARASYRLADDLAVGISKWPLLGRLLHDLVGKALTAYTRRA